jgi:heptosyltransferase-2
MSLLIKYVFVSCVWVVLLMRQLFKRKQQIHLNGARCLIVSLSGIGNSIMCTPLVQSLEENGADSIDVLLPGAAHAAIFNGIQFCNAIHRYPKSVFQRFKLLLLLRQKKYDALFFAFPTAEISYSLFPLIVCPRISVIHDGDMFHPFFKFTRRMFEYIVPVEASWHDIEQNLNLLSAIGGKIAKVERYPLLTLPEHAHKKAKEYLSEQNLTDADKLCFMHPGCTRGTDFKRWPTENFVELGKMLIERYACKIVVIIGPDEKEYRNYFNVPGFTILESQSFDVTLVLLSKALVLISNDSGLMHAAALLRVPTVTMWGGTDVNRNGARGSFAINIENERLPCQPCSRFVSEVNCPGIKYECIRSISVQQVYDAVAYSSLLD